MNKRIQSIEQMAMQSVDLDGLNITFYRTTRVPEGKMNSLPAGLGNFPVYKVRDFKSGVPSDWQEDGFFLPMYKSEAMWMGFNKSYNDPSALIVAAGNINAISGKPFEMKEGKRKKSGKIGKSRFDIRLEDDQNYLVVPPQPWIDGWKAEDGKVYQFVAAEMGSGETVEGQITGEEKFGGIQLIRFQPRKGIDLTPQTRPNEYTLGGKGTLGGMWADDGPFPNAEVMLCCAESCEPESKSISKRSVQSMGLGKGGEISQKIYPDPYGLDVWNQNPASLSRIYLVSSNDFKQITGHNAPATPVTYQKYQELNMPWFDLYDENYNDTKGSSVFNDLKTVSDGPKLVNKLPGYKPLEETKVEHKKYNIFK